MFEELNGRRVKVQMGSVSMFTDKYEGLVIDISESWIKLKTKNKIITVNMSLIGSISIDGSYEQVVPK